jgi:hypothetical protein
MTRSSLSSRIKESAAGLARDIFSGSANDGCGALATTNELETLRSAHKLSSTRLHGNSSSPRISRPLSGRHRRTDHLGRQLKDDPDPCFALELEDDLSRFLHSKCETSDTSASSSESESRSNVALQNDNHVQNRALSRLQSILSQLPAAEQTKVTAGVKQVDRDDSSYNQICGGEDAQEWAAFEASLFRSYSMQTTLQQSGQTTARNISERVRVPPGSDKEKEPVVDFHCPWIDCHNVSLFQRTYTCNKTDNSNRDSRCVQTISEIFRVPTFYHACILTVNSSLVAKRYGISMSL